nr:metalloregulator ArsR/SmtB family transcription factor [Metabacillus mangrovi]
MDTKVKFLRGFSDKTRIQILEALLDGEKTVSQITEKISGNQSNISQHLACLKGCGIITGRQEGRYSLYRIRNDQIRELLMMFNTVLADIENDVERCGVQIEE